MSAAAVILVAALSVAHFQCPEGIPYDVNIAGSRMAIVSMNDIDHCILDGSNAHCKVGGKSLLDSDVYDMKVAFRPGEIILRPGIHSVICKSVDTAPIDLQMPPQKPFLKLGN